MTEKALPESPFDFETVFGVDDYVYFYGEALTDERTEAEVAGLVNLLELDAPMQILDVPCGFGRHSICLAALGHEVTGIDLMPGFLDIARRDAEDRGVQVAFQSGDMRFLDLDEGFDRVMNLFTSFGYYEDEENLRILQNMARALRPGGLLALDIPNRDAFLKRMLPHLVTERDGNLMIDRLSFDSLSGRWVNRRVIVRDGVRKDKPFFVRLYNPNEIQALIAQAGLQLHALYGGFEAQPVSLEARRMIVVARKPE